MPQSVNIQSTKKEILDAYEEVVKLLAQKDNSNQSTLPLNIIPKSKPFDPQSPEEIINKAGELKLGLNKILSTLVEDLTGQSEQLELTKKELTEAKNELENVYKIKTTASTLQNLLSIHQEQKTQLELELEEMKKSFELEKEQKSKLQKEEAQELEKNRKREQEDYDYNLKLKRKIEEDNYTREKEAKIRELEQRELKLKNSEKELDDLRSTSAGYEVKLANEIKKAFENGQKETTKELEIAYNLERKDVDRESQLDKMTIQNLQKTITNQETEITELKKQLIQATQQVKEIALKVIETKPNENRNNQTITTPNNVQN